MSTLTHSRGDLLLQAAPASLTWLAPLQRAVRGASLGWSQRHYSQALQSPQAFQEKWVRQILAQNANTAYGKAHSFKTIGSVEDFQAHVPIVNYETVKPWISQIADGAARVLTEEPVVAVRQSGGSGGTPKLIPVTQGLLDASAAALRPWLHGLLQHQPALWQQKLYWEMPPSRQLAGSTRGGVPYAGASPGPWVGGVIGRALLDRLAVSPEVSVLTQPNSWRTHTLYSLLLCDDLGAMLLGNPANALELMGQLEEDLPDLLERLPTTRANAIRRGLDEHGQLNSAALWPQLKTMAVWRDGTAAPLARLLAERFPAVRLQSSPMTLQEAILTVPQCNHAPGAPLAVASHFFEFLDTADLRRPPLLAHALRKGGVYLPVITTAGGLYRYQLDDAVHCVGHLQQTPCIEHVEKDAPVSNMCGERLTPQRVQRALEQAVQSLGLQYDFALCAPLPKPQRGYCMYLDTPMPDAKMAELTERLEAALCRDYAYWACRQHGQLDGLRILRVRNGWQRYRHAMQEFNAERWHIKPSVLDPRAIWPMVFA